MKAHLFGLDGKAARVTWTAAITLLLLAAIYAIRGTLVVFAVAVLLAYLLNPLVGLIGQAFAPKNRTLALALTYLIAIGLIAVIGLAIVSRVAVEARQLIAQPPDIRGFLDTLRLAHPQLAPVIELLHGRILEQLGEVATTVPRLGLGVLAASANLIYVVVIPILSFFLLKDGALMRDAFLQMFENQESRAGAERTLAEINVLLAQYMRALLILCCSALAVLGVALAMAGVRYALLLASVAFFCEFVPMVGPLVEIVVIMCVSALTGYTHILALAAGLGIFRLVQDYVIWPRLMSQGIELHPLWVIFGVFAGADIGGVAGVFLAVPLLALGRLILIPARTIQPTPTHAQAAAAVGT